MIAAEAIVCTYLGQRALPPPLHGNIVCQVKARLIQGSIPVLDRSLRELIESECIQAGLSQQVSN